MIIDKFKSILKNYPDKTAILYKEYGHLIVKNFEELYYDMFRMISYMENKGLEPGNKILTKYKNNYPTILLLLAALYRNYEITFLTKDSFLYFEKKYDFYSGNGFIDSIFKSKKCKKSFNNRNYIYGDKDEIGFGKKGSFKLYVPFKNKTNIIEENDLESFFNIMKQSLYNVGDIGCMICDDVFQTLLNVLCGCPSYIINKRLIFWERTIVNGAVSSCFLRKENLLKIKDKKKLIKTVFYVNDDIEDQEEKFKTAQFIKVNFNSLEANK
ncbi:MAG: hypothetical protein ACI311_05535 [Bacilli bacterium]